MNVIEGDSERYKDWIEHCDIVKESQGSHKKKNPCSVTEETQAYTW